ncbi:MAG: ATP-binding protein [Phenylobacterium sp.]|uniref:ATP-binding protein n=1 Tax=Phenylobacterium sp. TaxID=1871053 RepID=UPI00391D87A8
MDGDWRGESLTGADARIAARLARAAETTRHGVILCDPDGRVEWVNEGFTAITGFTLDDAAGRRPGELLQCEATDPATRNLMAARIAAQEGFRVEILNQGKDGRRFWIDLEVRPTYAADGALEGFQGTLVENIHSAQIEQSNVATPVAVRSAARLARVGGWDIDLKTRTVRWGGELWKLLGRPSQVESAADSLTLYAEEERDRVEAHISESIRTGRMVDLEARAVAGDGKPLWLRIIGEPEFVDGVCVAVRGASQDITAQRNATEELREQQRFAQGVVDGVPALLTVIDQDGHIVAANRAFKALGAALRGEDVYPMGGNLFEIVARLPGAHGRAIERGLRKVLDGRKDAYSRAYHARSGEWFRMSAARFAGEGPVRCVVITQSIEDLKRSERRLRQLNANLKKARDEADAANAAKSAFLATMSHEIRTPLNGVLGMAQAMARDALPARQRERLSVIRQAGETLLALLNDLLDLSRIEAGRLELEDGVIDVRRLLESVRGTFESLALEKNLAFTVAVEPQAEGAWRGDATRVRQILYNLASNAVKFTAAGSVQVKAYVDGGRLALEVRDTGPGIAADRLDALFEKFVQADASTTRRFGGSGLGLAICRELATLMGGEITARSVEGQGSVFTVRLPLARAPHATAPADPAARPLLEARRERLRILAVDDNPMNQLVLRTLLEQLDIEVRVVADGLQALQAWEQETWSAILMDVQMPVMDGPTATRAIREREQDSGRRRTPIIALTANAMAHHEAEYLAAGMDALSPKPIELERLLDTLEALLDAPRDA